MTTKTITEKKNRVIKFRAWTGDKMITQSCRTDWEILHEARVRKWKLMQFTGLLDRNGREIYEGDLISTKMCCDDKCHEVFWNTGEFQHYWAVRGKNGHFTGFQNDGEIVGNIYENAELLK
jgi:uncharacterized phage protein (TIGR01671 family)